MNEIARGAEAVIFEDKGVIIKHRLKKNYRLPELDSELRSQRTKREANLLRKIKVPHPKLVECDEKEKIVMEKIDGPKLRDVLDDHPILARRAGELAAEMHNQGVMHGDLTTSNIILDKKGELVLIDFGLSFQSHQVEDKAVDIHLFKQALNSKHHRVYEKALHYFLEGYRKANQYDEIMERLKKVEQRGRYKH
jgi:Kae1-associated kinase Bud32